MLRNIFALSLCLLLSCALAPKTHAQQLGAATLRGVVTDPDGAVVAGASVKATLVATGARDYDER